MQLEVQVLVTHPREIDKIRQREADVTKERIEKLLKAGANVVLTTKGINDMALKYFVEVGAIAVRRVRKEDLPHVPKATGATADPYFTVETFKSLKSPHAWYKMDKLRVYFVWMDKKANKLYLLLHDKHGEWMAAKVRMAAKVPQDLVESYKNKNLEKTFVFIHHFQIHYVDPTQYQRHENYSFLRNDWVIAVNSKTVVYEILYADEIGFVKHP